LSGSKGEHFRFQIWKFRFEIQAARQDQFQFCDWFNLATRV
jgi:hypothetical protein